MGLITVAQSADGDTANASDINTPVNTIANEFNGNIDNANIKSTAAISGSKIADRSIDISAKALNYTGWITETNTWAYSSGTGTITGVFTIAGVDATSYLEPGMRIKLTQTQVKYGIITKVAFSTDTTVTVLMAATSGTVDNSGITNTTISSPAFSRDKIPFGFPLDPSKWTVTSSDTTDTSYTSGITNIGSQSLSIPIGAWRVRLEGIFWTSLSSTSVVLQIGLSTANNTFSDLNLFFVQETRGASGVIRVLTNPHINGDLNLASPTTYFVNMSGSGSGGTFGSTYRPTIASAVCAYL